MESKKTYYRLLRYREVVKTHNKLYKPYMTKKGFWREFVEKQHQIGYRIYLDILGEPNIQGRIDQIEAEIKEREAAKKSVLKNQMKLKFEEFK